MFSIRIGLSLLMAVIMISEGHSGEREGAVLEDVIRHIHDAVVRKDIGALMEFVHPTGTVFIDSGYTKAEILSLMKDPESWLHKHLFVGENSVRTYFLTAKNLKINVHRYNENAVFVSFASSNHQRWPECCFIKIDNKWVFSGIFSCE